MKKIVKSAVFLLAFASASIVNADPLFNYSYTFSDGHVVSGSFNGVVNGDLVTNLTNITAALDGTSFPASFGDHWVQGQAVVGGAQASFSGNSNNFMFADQDYATTMGYVEYLRYISDTIVDTYDTRTGIDHADWYADPTHWSLVQAQDTQASVPEPESYALVLAGMGLMGLTLRKRKSS
jgi:hypothetical protein